MKAITFLGAAKAHKTTYVMPEPDGREHEADYFGVALARFHHDQDLDYMKVFVTEKAREMHWEDFKRQAEDYVDNLEAVDIPDGANENELWALFQTVVDAVDEREEVIFDITHGFRSLPFLSLLAVAYLRQVKDIQLRAVFYGNYDAESKRAPVIDLSGFVSLFDWMTSADLFTRFGDATDLAALLRDAKPPKRNGPPDPDTRQWTKRISLAARSLEDISLALRLIRPYEAMHASSELKGRLLDASQSIPDSARPFAPLLHSIIDTYEPLAIPREQQEMDKIEQLACEREMVYWLLERKQYVQAATIAREWIFSWVMVQVEMDDILDKNKRDEVETILGKALQERRDRGACNDATFSNGTTLCSIGQISQALDILRELRDPRNDLLHAGKRRSPLPAKTMAGKVANLCSRLSELNLPA